MTAIRLERRFANFRLGLRARPAAAQARHRPSRDWRRAARGRPRRRAGPDAARQLRARRGARRTLLPIERARLARLPGQPPADAPLLCLDTETTGLATAAGTLAFLVGLGWWEGSRFRQVQLLLPDHADEPALLDELARYIPRDGWLVTYNGRGFDWPLLVARYRMAGSNPPLHAGHLDLLPLVRRVFRHRMTDARLASVEAELLGPAPPRRRRGLGDPVALPRLPALRRARPARRRGPPQRRGRPLAGAAPGPRRPRLRGRRALARGARRATSRALPGRSPARAATTMRARLPRCGRSRRLCIPPVPRQRTGSVATDAALASRSALGSRSASRARTTSRGGRRGARRTSAAGPGRYPTGRAWDAAESSRRDAPWTETRMLAERARLLRRLGRYRRRGGGLGRRSRPSRGHDRDARLDRGRQAPGAPARRPAGRRRRGERSRSGWPSVRPGLAGRSRGSRSALGRRLARLGGARAVRRRPTGRTPRASGRPSRPGASTASEPPPRRTSGPLRRRRAEPGWSRGGEHARRGTRRRPRSGRRRRRRDRRVGRVRMERVPVPSASRARRRVRRRVRTRVARRAEPGRPAPSSVVATVRS